MSARRGLRTRVYDANMSMVENNYRAALERLEKSRRAPSLDREVVNRRPSPFVSRYDFNGAEVDEELQAARSRASKVIHEKSVIDQRAEQFRSSSLAPAPVSSALLESEFDDQVQATLERIRASKGLLSQLQSDDALESYRSETRSKLSEQSARKLAEKLSETNYDEDDFASSGMSTRKALKMRASTESSSLSKSSQALKWKDETAESFASKRASATRARLQDIDQEIEDFEQKQAARARRSAQLKQLLAETSAQELVPAGFSQHTDGTKISTGVVKIKTTQKKMVSF
ncbi:AGAP007250-PA-like protein [Anopheles sinensis]|uniref:AGAP007250-PA-like protein n=1 Tax=Anopheles sinensis TaxID=74873 RepID=A0A084VQV9_ANOSI|nr:AGAP007250-PA-like protein [Anopheles sinensis]